MADDLGDDWWEEKKDGNDEESSEEETETPAKEVPMETSTAPSTEPKTKKKKRRKKKNITDELKETGNVVGNGEDFIAVLEKQFKGKLSQVELDEIKLDTDRNFFASNPSPEFPVAYMRSVLPKWKKLKNAVTDKGSPVLLVICASALRAVDLNRQLKEFKGEDCKCAKLFAKHMKLDGQEKLLKSSVCHMGIGTPNRILTLIKSGHLKLDKLNALVVDWNWRDVKKRRVADVPEIRAELATLLQKYLIPHIKTELNCKIGML